MANIRGIEVAGETYDIEDTNARQGVETNANDIDNIQAVVPSSASSSNKLATANEVQEVDNKIKKRKTGSIRFTCNADSWTTANVTFDTPLESADYDVFLESGSSSYVHVQNVTAKSANGFIVIIYNRDTLEPNQGIINWSVLY